MPLTDWMEQQLLDWMCGGAAASSPIGRWISFATATPNSTSAFDGPFQSRATVTFAAANSPAGSATTLQTTLAAQGTCTAAATVVGWNLWDRSVGGTRFAWGTVTANIGCKSADQAQFVAGGIKIILA